MSKRIQQRVSINGEIKWISGATQQELFEAYLSQAIKCGVVTLPDGSEPKWKDAPSFGAYLHHFIQTYKSRQSALTMMNRKRVVERHIVPRLGSVPIDAIGTADIQIWFDELCEQGYSRETILKIKHTISPVFDSAVEVWVDSPQSASIKAADHQHAQGRPSQSHSQREDERGAGKHRPLASTGKAHRRFVELYGNASGRSAGASLGGYQP